MEGKLIYRQLKILTGIAAICLILITGGLACGAGTAGKLQPVTVTEENSGESIQLQQGQQLIVRLTANPSTGYSWSLVDTPDSTLTVDGPIVFEQDQSGGNQPLIGAGGTEVCTFTAGAAGQQTLQLEYKRSWEAGVAPAKSVSYNVTVK